MPPLFCSLRSCLLLVIVPLSVCAAPPDPVVAELVARARAHPAGDVPASFAVADFAGELRDLPIGVFDSGVGGLTVFESLKTYDAHNNTTGGPGADGVPDFAGERFLYLGDQANMPYGNYPAAGQTDFLRELVLKDALFLLGRRYWRAPGDGPVADKPPVKAIVIACNTATAYGLEDLRAALAAWGLPVIVVGVVEAGARGLAETRGPAQGGIAVLATVGTCASNAYPKAFARVQPAKTPWAVCQHGSATLAAAIEGDPAITEPLALVIHREVLALLDEQRAAPAAVPLDTVVLGCTHYPLVQEEILRSFAAWRDYAEADGTRPYAGLVSAKMRVVDPAAWTAEDLWRALQRAGLEARKRAAVERDLFYLSVANPTWPGVRLEETGGLAKDYKYSRRAGEPGREDTVVVPLTAGRLPAGSARLVRERLPRTWAGLQAAGH